MRFIIYREEFVAGRRTTDLPEVIFATEDEAVARSQIDALFAEEMEDYLRKFSPVEARKDGRLWAVSSSPRSRFVRLGLIDEQDPSTHLPG